MKARVYVTLKSGVLDPQGEAIRQALGAMGYNGVADVRQGKVFDIAFEADAAATQAELDEMCRRLLANTVIESYRIEIE